MAKGFGIRAMAEGFLSGSNGNGHSSNGTNGTGQVDSLIGSLGRLIVPALEKLTGSGGATPAQADAVVRALAANPQALQAIADALAEADGGAVKGSEVQTGGGTHLVEAKNGAVPVAVG